MAEKDDENSSAQQKASVCSRFQEWFGGAHCCVYVTFVMGAWGDRMWEFAAGLYLVSLSDGVLRLAAVLGFAGGGCILLLGGVIGNWVDENPRLKVVRICLFIQNLSVALCAVSVCLTLHFMETIHQLYGGNLRYLSEFLIIVLAILAALGSVAYKIAIEKDWIVVVAGQDTDQLANLNARMRAIDLLCSLLAPMTVGFVMSYTSLLVSAVVIAVWNVFSVVVEYGLLCRVYKLVPRLATKQDAPVEDPGNGIALEPLSNGTPGSDPEAGMSLIDTKPAPHPVTNEESEPEKKETVSDKPESSKNQSEPDQSQTELDETSSLTNTPKSPTPETETSNEDGSCTRKLFRPFVTFVRGWKTYARQKVVFAGLSLAFLYMTVLGLDSVTTGYIYATGVAEYWVGVAMGLSGLSGVFGTFVFTWLHKKNGLERTGLVAFNLEIMCLCFCVASVWAPGSPFDPYYKLPTPGLTPLKTKAQLNCSTDAIVPGNVVVSNRTRRAAELEELNLRWTGFESRSSNLIGEAYLGSIIGSRRKRQSIQNETTNTTDILANRTTFGSTKDECKPLVKQGWNVATMLLIIGLITSRTGLWMADLTITQLLQENVAEKERGIVNGVQNSLNMFMDMLKFALVIVIPYVETYGYLVLLSFTFICIGGVLFAYHSWRVRGHLFHFEKICGGGGAQCISRPVGGDRGMRPRDPAVEVCM